MKDHPAMSTTTRRNRAMTDRRGFTLIELLVVVAVIALLIGILLPALGAARGTAWEVVSNARKRDLFQSQNFYASDNDDFIPGVGTSGARMRHRLTQGQPLFGTGSITGPQHLERANRDPSYPTSGFDWASPALVGDNMPTNRAERMWYIWEQFGCPAQGQRSVVWLQGNEPLAAQARQECLDLVDRRGQLFPATSFMQPLGFAMWGQRVYTGPTAFTANADFLRGDKHPFDNPVTIPQAYSPRIANVGTQSSKIALADGFRYHDGDIVDFDPGIAIQIYGPWTDSGPIFVRSTAYGLQGSGNPSNGANIPLSYRHRGRMGAVHFDGSAKSYTLEESHNPTLWYPSRSRWTGIDALPNSVNFLPPAPSDGSPRLIP